MTKTKTNTIGVLETKTLEAFPAKGTSTFFANEGITYHDDVGAGIYEVRSTVSGEDVLVGFYNNSTDACEGYNKYIERFRK